MKGVHVVCGKKRFSEYIADTQEQIRNNNITENTRAVRKEYDTKPFARQSWKEIIGWINCIQHNS